MFKQLIINLPVKSVEDSKQFFSSIGLSFNEKLSDDNATCFDIEDRITIALLPNEHFKETINGNDVATTTTSETLLAIGVESNEAAQNLLDKAVKAGAEEIHERFESPEIYAGSFKDLDGHLWNIFCMH